MTFDLIVIGRKDAVLRDNSVGLEKEIAKSIWEDCRRSRWCK